MDWLQGLGCTLLAHVATGNCSRCSSRTGLLAVLACLSQDPTGTEPLCPTQLHAATRTSRVHPFPSQEFRQRGQRWFATLTKTVSGKLGYGSESVDIVASLLDSTHSQTSPTTKKPTKTNAITLLLLSPCRGVRTITRLADLVPVLRQLVSLLLPLAILSAWSIRSEGNEVRESSYVPCAPPVGPEITFLQLLSPPWLAAWRLPAYRLQSNLPDFRQRWLSVYLWARRSFQSQFRVAEPDWRSAMTRLLFDKACAVATTPQFSNRISALASTSSPSSSSSRLETPPSPADRETTNILHHPRPQRIVAVGILAHESGLEHHPKSSFRHAHQASRHRVKHLAKHAVYHAVVHPKLETLNEHLHHHPDNQQMQSTKGRSISNLQYSSRHDSWTPLVHAAATGRKDGQLAFVPDSRATKTDQETDIWHTVLRFYKVPNPGTPHPHFRCPGEQLSLWGLKSRIWLRILGFAETGYRDEDGPHDLELVSEQVLSVVQRLEGERIPLDTLSSSLTTSDPAKSTPGFAWQATDHLGLWPAECLEELASLLSQTQPNPLSLWVPSAWRRLQQRVQNLAAAGLVVLASRGDVFGEGWRHLLSLLDRDLAQVAVERLVIIPRAQQVWMRALPSVSSCTNTPFQTDVWSGLSLTQVACRRLTNTLFQSVQARFVCPRLVSLLQAGPTLGATAEAVDETWVFRAWVSVWVVLLPTFGWLVFSASGLVCVVDRVLHTACILPWRRIEPAFPREPLELWKSLRSSQSDPVASALCRLRGWASARDGASAVEQDQVDLFRVRLTHTAFYVPLDILSGRELDGFMYDTGITRAELNTEYDNNGTSTVETYQWSHSVGLVELPTTEVTADQASGSAPACALCGLPVSFAVARIQHDEMCIRRRTAFDRVPDLDAGDNRGEDLYGKKNSVKQDTGAEVVAT